MRMLTTYIRAIENPFAVEVADVEAEKASGQLKSLARNRVEYLKEVKDVNISPALIEEFGKDMKIVTLHGTGEMLARRGSCSSRVLTLFKLLKRRQLQTLTSLPLNLQILKSQAAFALLKELVVRSRADLVAAA